MTARWARGVLKCAAHKPQLALRLKGCWFDVMVTGEKRTEYRTASQYWITRLDEKTFRTVKFTRGYARNAPFFVAEWKSCRRIVNAHARYSNGAEIEVTEETFAIELGDIVVRGNM